MEEIKYTINRVEYEHRELTWGQDKKLIAMIKKVSGKVDGKETIAFNAKKLKGLVSKYDLLGDFWGLILHPRRDFWYWAQQGVKLLQPWRWRPGLWRWVNMAGVSNSMLEEMFDDFFLINKSLMKRLSGLSEVLSLIVTAAQNGKTEKSSSLTPKKPPQPAPQSAGN